MAAAAHLDGVPGGAGRNGSRVNIQPQDESGLLDLDAVLGAPEPGTVVYCCGPEALVAAMKQRCQSWLADALHVEHFSGFSYLRWVMPGRGG